MITELQQKNGAIKQKHEIKHRLMVVLQLLVKMDHSLVYAKIQL